MRGARGGNARAQLLLLPRLSPPSLRARLGAVCATAMALFVPLSAATAQDPVARADYLMRVGRVFAAESVYYWAASRSPKDPVARLALGRFLAARGSLRTAATLMEEARFFGGDAAEVAVHLAPVYDRLGEYRALASLPRSPLSAGEQLRAEWLRDNRPTRRGPDSTVTALDESLDESALGVIVLRIGGDSVRAVLDARSVGLVLDTSWAHRRGVRRFGDAGASDFGDAGASDPERIAGVLNEVVIEAMVLGNVPVSFAAHASPGVATVGLDFISRFAPTFDHDSGTLTLRPRGRVPPSVSGRRIPTLMPLGGEVTMLAVGGALLPIGGAEAAQLLGRRWTMGSGEVLVH